MAINRNLINKGIYKLAKSVPLLFLGPFLIYNAFINKENIWHYAVLIIGILASLGAMFFIFKGLNTIVKGIFNE